MKTIKSVSIFLAVLLMGLSSCGDVRELPTGKVITLYNSNLEETKKMDMLDTLYVKVGALEPNTMYTVEALDPDNNLITKMTVMSDGDGVIQPSVLWYDVGLRKDNKEPDIGGSLSLKAFYIHVTGPDTDYKEPFYIVYSQDNVGEQPKPIVWATTATGELENAFDETGTVDELGNPGETKVYVEAKNIPAVINSTEITAVDIYVVASKGAGNLWEDGTQIVNAVTSQTNVSVYSDSTGAKVLGRTLLWDLDAGPNLINPGETNNAYDIILDVDRDGVFDIGVDVNSDGKIDRYIDGIDGQGVVGFVVNNTPANDFFVTITDADGNEVDTVNDSGSVLNIALKNVPPGSSPLLHLYNAATTDDAITPISLTVKPAEPDNGYYLPYVALTPFINTVDSSSAEYPSNVTDASVVTYDLAVDGVGSTSYTATIKVIHPPAALYTSNGIANATVFDETGTQDGNTNVYVKTVGLSLSTTATVYVIPTRTGAWTNGDTLSSFNPTVSKSIDPVSGNIPETLIWDLDTSPTLINPDSSNNTYDVILDVDNDGTYDTGDWVNSPGFVVRDTEANDLPEDLIYVNIASGGKFVYNSTTWTYDYDYRDTFAANGLDTYQSYYVDYGIKAIWNPYIRWWGTADSTVDTPSIYYGTYVDVYIVDATKARANLTKSNVNSTKLGQGNLEDVTEGVETIPVQYSCSNGAGQQNIWLPNFTVGDYYVIIDVDGDGYLTEGVDFVDAVKQNGTTIVDDWNVVGFSVVE